MKHGYNRLYMVSENKTPQGFLNPLRVLSWKPKEDIVRTLCGHMSLEIYRVSQKRRPFLKIENIPNLLTDKTGKIIENFK